MHQGCWARWAPDLAERPAESELDAIRDEWKRLHAGEMHAVAHRYLDGAAVTERNYAERAVI